MVIYAASNAEVTEAKLEKCAFPAQVGPSCKMTEKFLISSTEV
jgi:hypothetical protein